MKKIIINDSPWQTRIAIEWNGELNNIYFSTPAAQTLERSFFKGTVTKVLPGIQTAFVDIGQERAGFLHISEIDREMAIEKMSKSLSLDEDDDARRKKIKSPRQQKRDIGKILKEGDTILVQVAKEPIYEKGAKLTTCFTLPGRFLVLMPNIPRFGVSKKIEDREERWRLKNIVRDNIPEGMGAIIRTTSEGRNQRDIIKDINYLVREWRSIEKAFKSAKPQDRIYDDLPLTLQIIRDHLDDDVEAVVTDNKENQSNIYKFVKRFAPEHSHKIKMYQGPSNIFEFYGIEKQIRSAFDKKVELKSGGSLIIETTEAMTVVDVNTGRFTGKGNMEETILKTNLEAAEEVTRQLKLRNIGGLIVIDFIDMAVPANRQKLFTFFERLLKERDKFQSVVLKVSEFGLLQMTRKRSGKSLIQELADTCPKCHGLGFVESVQSKAFYILRNLKQEMRILEGKKEITLLLNPEVFDYVAETEYNAILALEQEYGIKITLKTDKTIKSHNYKIK